MGTSPDRRAFEQRVALSGTPGTGKSAVGRRLRPERTVAEVGELALREGVGRSIRGDVEVDLPALARRMGPAGSVPTDVVLVGHLAHLLPVHDVVVLRCRPDVLVRRLRTARRGTETERKENFLAEALDVVLSEAVERGCRVWEVDTTRRSVASVAAEVEGLLVRRPAARFGGVDWLSDRRVAAHLLDPPA
jgi:adenylate kinase